MFGNKERKVLLTAFKSPPGQWVWIRGEDEAQNKLLRRAVYRLQSTGLIEKALIEPPLTWPRVPRIHVRLTHAGRTFCELFQTPLLTGSRIAVRLFEQATGTTIPTKRKVKPQWLSPGKHPHHVRNLNHDRTASQTAA